MGTNTAEAADAVASTASKKVESLRSSATDGLNRVADKAQSALGQGVDAVGDAARKAQDLASNAQDTIVSFTRDNPVKALLIAAAAGAGIVTLVKAFSSVSSD